VYFGRKFSIYVQIFDLWPKVASEKQRQLAVSAQTATFCSPEGKKPCNSPRKVLDEDDQEKQPKINAQLETNCQTLTSVESRLQNLENIFERVSGLEKLISNFGTELSKLSNKTKEIKKTASDVETAMAFASTERLRR